VSAGAASSLPSYLRAHPDGTRLLLHVQPRASRNEIVGEFDGRLKLRVVSPPVEGQANEAVCKFLSRTLRVPKSSVRLVVGASGRQKDVVISGIAPDVVVAALT